MKTLFVIIVFLLSSALYADWDEEQKLTASDATEDDHFGNSVSIDGDYAVIGAVWDDENGYASGSAYIFHKNGTGWIEQTKITASNGSTEDRFGHSVSISGDYAIVGAPYYDDILENTGEAYIFHRNGTNWTQQARLAVADVAEEDLFGWSVSISGDYAVVGAVDADDNGSASGCAYVFHRNGTSWILQEKLTASDGEQWDNFGQSVSISGGYVVVGAHWNDNDGTRSGSAYIFRRSDGFWLEEAKITASDADDEDWFGHSVSISGDYAVIGAYGGDDDGSNSGAAYIFHRSGTNWTEQAKIIASDGEQFDNFGYTASISGNYAAFGAAGYGNNGAAYIFHRSGTDWTEDTKLTASDGESDDWFGRSVSISGYYALIGAWQDDDNGPGSGSAYLYTNTSTQSCLPEGVTFNSQEDIDSFQSDYPGCIEIEGGVVIDDDSKDGELKNLDGLSILTSIGGYLSIQNNMYLESLTGLDNLMSIGGDLLIEGNAALFSLTGLNNIDAGSIDDIYIYDNSSLSFCEVQSICDYLVSPNGNIEIHDNAMGCNSQQEVDSACVYFSIQEIQDLVKCVANPNPFSTSTTIEYELKQPEKVTLTIYDYLGKQVYQVQENQPNGKQQLLWYAERLPDGIYYFRLQAGEQVAHGKMVKCR